MTLLNNSPAADLVYKLNFSIKLVERNEISFEDMKKYMDNINKQLRNYILDLQSIKIKYHVDQPYFTAVKKYIDKVIYVHNKVSIFSINFPKFETSANYNSTFNIYDIIKAYFFNLEKKQQELSTYITELKESKSENVPNKKAKSENVPQKKSINTEFIELFGQELVKKSNNDILFKFINFAMDPFYRTNPYNMMKNSDIKDIFVKIEEILGKKLENNRYYFNVLFEDEIIEICEIILAKNKANAKELIDYKEKSDLIEANNTLRVEEREEEEEEGQTTLHLAGEYNLTLLASWLLQNNCDITICNKGGALAYCYALALDFPPNAIPLNIIESAARRKLPEDYFTKLFVSTWQYFDESYLPNPSISDEFSKLIKGFTYNVSWKDIIPYVQLLSRLILEGADLNADMNKYFRGFYYEKKWKSLKGFFDLVETNSQKIMLAVSIIFCLTQLQPSNKTLPFTTMYKFQFAEKKCLREIANYFRAKEIILDCLFNNYTFAEQYLFYKLDNGQYSFHKLNDIIQKYNDYLCQDFTGITMKGYEKLPMIPDWWIAAVVKGALHALPTRITNCLQAAKNPEDKNKIGKLLYKDPKLKAIATEIVKNNQKFKWVLEIWEDLFNKIDRDAEDSSGDESSEEEGDTYYVPLITGNDSIMNNEENEGEGYDADNSFGY